MGDEDVSDVLAFTSIPFERSVDTLESSLDPARSMAPTPFEEVVPSYLGLATDFGEEEEADGRETGLGDREAGEYE